MNKLLFDFGHGEETPGKRSPDGQLREYAYVREIGNRVAEYFRTYTNVPVSIITPETSDVSLKERVARANRTVDADPSQKCLFVSFHVNAAPGEGWQRARGWEVYVARTSSQASKDLANTLYQAANDLGCKTRRPKPSQNYWCQNFYVLKNTKCPAVLTENFFQNNKEDMEFLLSETGKETVVNIHILGLSRYLNIPCAVKLA